MESLRSAIRYYKALNRDEIDHEDIFALKIAKFMSFGRSWWTKEDYKKASKWDKLFFYFIVLCLFYLCFTTGLNCILHPTSQHSPVHLMNEISFSLTVFTCGCGILWTNWRRNSLSNVLTTVNEKSLAILKTESDRRNYRQRRNRIQCFSIGLFTTFQTFAIFDIISFCVQFFVYGRAQFVIFFAANSFLENFQFFLHMVVNLWLTIYTPSYFTIIIEIFLRITLNYDILTYNLRNIGNWQEENREKRNYSQFKFAMKELSELQSVIEDMNSVISPYIAAWIALTINTTGILVANMTVVNSSGEALSCLPLLVWFISFLVTFCILGQFVSDSTSRVQNAAYSCDWYSAPIQFRKLLLMFLTRCQHEIIIDVKPFFVLNYELLAKFAKFTYTILMVMLKVS